MGVKEFFQNAFSDMKERAHAQYEVDKANFAAAQACIGAVSDKK